MLFAIVATFTYDSEASQDRQIDLYMNWTPPDGVDIQQMYVFSDGTGVLSIGEVESAAALFEALTPFNAYSAFEVKPLLPIEEMVPINERTRGWRHSVGS